MEFLDPIDALMLTAELVSSPMHVAVLMILAPPPGERSRSYVDDLYCKSLTAAGEIDPRLRRRPHCGAETGFQWVWRDAGEIDIRHHFQRRTLPLGRGPDALWELVADLHAIRLDRSVPLWMAYLIDGLPDGRFAFYIKVHHIVVDGVAGLQIITDSLSTDPRERSMPPFYVTTSATGRTAGESSPRPRSTLRAIGAATTAGVGLTRRVLRAELATVVGSLVSESVAAPFGAPHTRFNTKLGLHRSVAGTSMDRARIRAIQDAVGVSANDVATTVISGVVRAWLAERDELPRRSLVAICPVTVRRHRTSGSVDHGNQFGLGLCTLGTDIDDPAQRLLLVHSAMTNVKHQVAEQGPEAMLVVLAPAIGPTVLLPLVPFTSRIPPSYNMPISSVPGPRQQMYFNGARVDEIYPVSAVYDGMALNATMCSYGDRLGVGYVADRDVVADIGALIPLTEQALSELEAAVGV